MGHGMSSMQACYRAYCDERGCCFGNVDQAGQGPWMAEWVVWAHREWVGGMKATGFGLESTEVQGGCCAWIALGLSCPG